jgi:hypothetical protein
MHGSASSLHPVDQIIRELIQSGIIVTGYQVSSRAAASIPPGAQWLK